MKWLLLALYIAKIADLGTTEMVFSNGGWEDNPLMESRVIRWSAGFSAPIAIYKLTGLSGNRKAQAIVCAAIASFWGYLAIENYRLANRLKPAFEDSLTVTKKRSFRIQFAVNF